ncbi:hypothetical protein ABKN59_007963 [Abortiporus biennis]
MSSFLIGTGSRRSPIEISDDEDEAYVERQLEDRLSTPHEDEEEGEDRYGTLSNWDDRQRSPVHESYPSYIDDTPGPYNYSYNNDGYNVERVAGHKRKWGESLYLPKATSRDEVFDGYPRHNGSRVYTSEPEPINHYSDYDRWSDWSELPSNTSSRRGLERRLTTDSGYTEYSSSSGGRGTSVSPSWGYHDDHDYLVEPPVPSGAKRRKSSVVQRPVDEIPPVPIVESKLYKKKRKKKEKERSDHLYGHFITTSTENKEHVSYPSTSRMWVLDDRKLSSLPARPIEAYTPVAHSTSTIATSMHSSSRPLPPHMAPLPQPPPPPRPSTSHLPPPPPPPATSHLPPPPPLNPFSPIFYPPIDRLTPPRKASLYPPPDTIPLALPEPPVTAAPEPPAQDGVQRKTIGMPADVNPRTKYGTYPNLPADTAVSDPTKTLVMELLPKKFRNVGFVRQWAMNFGPQPRVAPRIELDVKLGKALIEFPSAEVAALAWGSARMSTGEGKEHVRVFWYCPPGTGIARNPADLEEGEIEEGEVSVKTQPSKKGKAKANQAKQTHMQPQNSQEANPPKPTRFSLRIQALQEQKQNQGDEGEIPIPPPPNEIPPPPSAVVTLPSPSHIMTQSVASLTLVTGHHFVTNLVPSFSRISLPSQSSLFREAMTSTSAAMSTHAAPQSDLFTTIPMTEHSDQNMEEAMDLESDDEMDQGQEAVTVLSKQISVSGSSVTSDVSSQQKAKSSSPTVIRHPLPPRPVDVSMQVRQAESIPKVSQASRVAPVPSIPHKPMTESVSSTASPLQPNSVVSESSMPPSEPSTLKTAPKTFAKKDLLARQKELEERIARSKEELAARINGQTAPSSPIGSPVIPVATISHNNASDVVKRPSEDDLRRMVLESKKRRQLQEATLLASCDESSNIKACVVESDQRSVSTSNSSTPTATVVDNPLATPDGCISTLNLDDLADSFISQSILSIPSTPMTPSLTPPFSLSHPPPMSEKEILAEKTKLLDKHIAESRQLMAKLTTAKTKQEREILKGDLRERDRIHQEAMRRLESLKCVTSRPFRWPETTIEECVWDISDDEDEPSG